MILIFGILQHLHYYSPQLRLVDKNGSPWGPSQFTGQRFSDDLLNPDNFDIEKYIKKLQDINISTDATNKQS